MKIILPAASSKHVCAESAAAQVIAFVADHQSALWHAARLRGGYEASRLVDRCVELLEQERAITNRSLMILNQLLALLAGEDPELPLMGFFAAIDPTDPIVEEICLLSDGLRCVLAKAEMSRDGVERQKKFLKAV
jgi:hypothetical protein